MFNLNIFPDGVLQWRHERFVTAAMTNANGYGTGTKTLFTVTGDVMLVRFMGICKVSLDGASATVAVGTSATPQLLLGLITGTNFDQHEIWVNGSISGTPDKDLGAQDNEGYVISNSNNIILTTGVQDLTAGVIHFHCFWYPLSPGATVVTA